MRTRRMASVAVGLTLTGLLLGALAGVIGVAAFLFALGLRHGRVDFPFTAFGSALGALIGGLCGAVLAPLAALSCLRHVPVGTLFGHLTAGTVLGGCVAALLLASPGAVLVGGVLGFLVAGSRLASPANAQAGAQPEPRASAG